MSHADDDDPDATVVLARPREKALRLLLVICMVGAIIAGGAFSVYLVVQRLLGPPDERAPRVHEALRPREQRNEQFGTLVITTNNPTATVKVGGRTRGIGHKVTVRRLTPAPQMHPVEVEVAGYPPRREWVKIPAGEEKTLHFEFGAEMVRVAPAPAPVAPATPPSVPGGPRPFTLEVAKLEPGELIWVVAEHYKVPVCLLWGIWKKETSLLASSWRGDRSDWFRGAKIIEDGGKCVERYGTEKCAKHWRALVSLCKQERNSAPIYNPDEVHTSYALAVGPMQHMPGELAKPCNPGSDEYCFTGDAVDFDADGVVDPWQLPDAFAMSALELRRYYEQGEKSWRRAANRYYGSQRGGYFEGSWKQLDTRTVWRDGVKQNWAECCRESGRCRAP